MNFTYCKDTYKVVSVDVNYSEPINVIKFPKRIIKYWFIFRWLVKPLVLEEGFYYENDNRYQFQTNNKHYIDEANKVTHKPFIKVKFSRIEGQGGFEKIFYRNIDTEIDRLAESFRNEIRNSETIKHNT